MRSEEVRGRTSAYLLGCSFIYPRLEKGLPPLPETTDAPETEDAKEAKPDESKSKTDKPSLSFSTSKPDRLADLKAHSLGKRKIRVSADDEDCEPKNAPGKKDKEKAAGKPKKPKKQKKALLSFGEDA